MAISVDWANKIVHVNKIDMVLLQASPTEIYQLDLDAFRLTLKQLEESVDGMAFQRIHKHNTSVPVGGVILARVVQIINGYTVTFEDGQYRVEAVGANSNIGSVVNVNSVSLSTANSAGLQDLKTLLSSGYQGQVVVDTVNGQSGTSTPIGTFNSPVDNLVDALAIALDKGVSSILLLTDLIITETLPPNINIIGKTLFTLVTVSPGANIPSTSFSNLTLRGDVLGASSLDKCILLDLTNLSGQVNECGFSSTVQVSGSLIVIQSYSQLEGLGFFSLDIGNSNVVVRDFHGSLGLTNLVAGVHSIGLTEGQLTLDNTCTGGTVYVRGTPYDILDSSAGTIVVDTAFSNWQKKKALTTSKFLGLT